MNRKNKNALMAVVSLLAHISFFTGAMEFGGTIDYKKLAADKKRIKESGLAEVIKDIDTLSTYYKDKELSLRIKNNTADTMRVYNADTERSQDIAPAQQLNLSLVAGIILTPFNRIVPFVPGQGSLPDQAFTVFGNNNLVLENLKTGAKYSLQTVRSTAFELPNRKIFSTASIMLAHKQQKTTKKSSQHIGTQQASEQELFSGKSFAGMPNEATTYSAEVILDSDNGSLLSSSSVAIDVTGDSSLVVIE